MEEIKDRVDAAESGNGAGDGDAVKSREDESNRVMEIHRNGLSDTKVDESALVHRLEVRARRVTRARRHPPPLLCRTNPRFYALAFDNLITHGLFAYEARPSRVVADGGRVRP